MQERHREIQVYCLECGERAHEPAGCRQPLEAGQGKEIDLPLQHPKGTQFLTTPDFSPIKPFWTSNIHYCKIIKLNGFQPLNLQYFLIVATGNINLFSSKLP